ncbi:extracellular solute-binding protein [Saccharospirillum impatiens]|uniref:extracellular solute-binding protein n=1 Tax=Saccharospirillum impatiens TaxID=169438 RepID=UPI000407D079|nr:extracellular solute-binding protein [Saccharospirillum impatiens]
MSVLHNNSVDRISVLAAPDEGLLRFLDYMDEQMLAFESAHSLFKPNAHMRMCVELLRRHFQGKVTSPTLLIDVSGVPYATATRRLNELVDTGLINRRARHKSERSFTLHPSDQLLTLWIQMAKDNVLLINDTVNQTEHKDEPDDRFYGSAYYSESLGPPLNVLSTPLSLAGGLRMLSHSDPTFMIMNSLKRHFELIVGCPIHQRSYSLDKLYDEAVENSGRDKSSYDLVAVNFPWIGEFAERGMLLPLDTLIDIEALSPTDFHAASWRASQWGGRCYGIPVETTCEVLMYRTDLFAQQGIEPPSTIEELLSAARKLHKPEKQIYGIAWNGARGTALSHTFMMAMADFGQPIIDLDPDGEEFSIAGLGSHKYRSMIDSDAGMSAAKFLLELVKYSPPGILTMSWYERTKSYAQGQVAMAYSFSQMTPYFEYDDNSPAKDNTGFIPHPAGSGKKPISPLGGFILGIPSNLTERRVEEAAIALETFTSKRAQSLYVKNGSRGCSRYSASEDPSIRINSPVFDAIDQLAMQDQLQAWPRPPTPEFGAITQFCGVVLHEMLRGVITPEEALTRAHEGVQKLIQNWQ